MINNHRSSWREAMPNYYDIDWQSQGLKAWIRPVGIRGWPIIRNLVPYFSGDIVHLTLIEKSDNKELDVKYDWSVWFYTPDGKSDRAKRIIGSLTSKSHKPTKHNFGSFLIHTPGHFLGQLELSTGFEDGQPTDIKKTVLIFDALAGDVWRTDIAFRLLIGVIGGLVGSILTLLITATGNSGG
jgi:hypothetical protein